MQSLKVLIVLMVGTFCLDIVIAGSIRIRQLGYYQSVLDISYTYNGQKLTKSSDVIAWNENKTVEIPNDAINIAVTANRVFKDGSKHVIFTQFYPSSVRKCFSTGAWVLPTPVWFEEPCQKLPATGLYSISVNQTNEFPIFFDLTYEYNGSNLTETSEIFDHGEVKMSKIPDGATKINFTIYSDFWLSYWRKRVIVTKFYPLPVEKCFEIYGFPSDYYWLEKPCKKLPAADGNFISLDQIGTSTVLLKVIYEYKGSNLTEYFGGIRNEENRTIQIPDEATNVNVTVYKERAHGSNAISWITGWIEMVFTKLYPSPVKKCFQLYSYMGVFTDDLWFEKSCQKLPAENGYSISVHQTGNFRAIFEVTYEYNSLNLTESSGIFLNEEVKTVQIPDKGTNIKVTIYGYHVLDMTRTIIVSQFYQAPIKKCFQLHDFGTYWSEKSCE